MTTTQALSQKNLLADSSAHRRWWRVLVAIAACLLTLATTFVLFIHPTYEGRLLRDNARDLLAPADGRAPVGLAGFLRVDIDTTAVYGSFLAVENPTSHPPLGLTQWPAPGEVFVSPAVLEMPGVTDAVGRYGKIAGTIKESGLVADNERLIYAGVDLSTAKSTDWFQPLYEPRIAHCASIYECGRQRNGPLWFSGNTGDTTNFLDPNHFYFTAATYLITPALIALAVIISLDSERKRHKLLTMTLLGASPRIVRRAVLREVLPPASFGAFSGFLIASVAASKTWMLPKIGFQVIGADLRHALPWVALSAVAITFLACVFGLLVYARTPRGMTGTRPTLPPSKPHSIVIFGVLALLIATNLIVSKVMDPFGDTQFPLYAFAAIIVLLLSGSILTTVFAVIAKFGTAISKKRNDAISLVAYKNLAALPKPTVRTAIGITIIAFLTVNTVALWGRQDLFLSDAQQTQSQNLGRVAIIHEQFDSKAIAEIKNNLPEESVLIGGNAVDFSTMTYTSVVGDKESLELIFGASSGSTTSAMTDYQKLAFSEEAPIAVVEDNLLAESDAFFVITSNNEPLDTEKIQSAVTTALGTANAQVALLGHMDMVTATFNQAAGGYYTTIGTMGIWIAFFVAFSALVFEVLRTGRAFAAVSMLSHSRITHIRLAGGILGIPLLSGAIIGICLALSLYISEFRAGTLPVPYALVVSTLGALLFSLTVITLATAKTIARYGTEWQSGRPDAFTQ
ncbi:hypothetical protein [Jonesia quinghaiensis]|uniref:hypothetical protein n=1 Tax=Jonesia quinghaiensis TaxID=262806 RepID=UPI000404354C|nr:hypothetical protein [Jonesia quinghaiensis]